MSDKKKPVIVRTEESAKGGSWSPLEAGTYSGVLVAVYHRGTMVVQPQDGNGKPYDRQEFTFVFELDANRPGTDKKAIEYLHMGYSGSSKSNWMKHMSSWLGADMPKIGEEWDLEALIGRPVYMSIVSYRKQNGTDGTKIGSLLALPKGAPAYKSDYKHQIYWSVLSDLDLEDEAVPEFVRLKTTEYFNSAAASKEFLAHERGKRTLLNGQSMNFNTAPPNEGDDDEVPY